MDPYWAGALANSLVAFMSLVGLAINRKFKKRPVYLTCCIVLCVGTSSLGNIHVLRNHKRGGVGRGTAKCLRLLTWGEGWLGVLLTSSCCGIYLGINFFQNTCVKEINQPVIFSKQTTKICFNLTE